jgi:hypothetical protein
LDAVRRGDEAVLRYIRPCAHGNYLVTNANMDNPNQWEQVQAPARDFLESAKARVRWLGR